MDNSRDPAEDRKQNVDEKVGTAATLEKDSELDGRLASGEQD